MKGGAHTQLACVTGATGMIGRRIVQRLLWDGYRIRVLSRRPSYPVARAELVRGDLTQGDSLSTLLEGCDLLFHCAAELNDEAQMQSVNVQGTEALMRAARHERIRYLCYLSTVGVVGRTELKLVAENCSCRPETPYEQSKWEAEIIVMRGLPGCSVVALRPANVVDEAKPGILNLAINPTLRNRTSVFVKGGECAHLIHADDVAAAAMHFIDQSIDRPQCYFVSCDEDPANTVAGVIRLYRSLERRIPIEAAAPVRHLPVILPYLFRRFRRRKGNPGDVRYSSLKLRQHGFRFQLGLRGAIERIYQARAAAP